MSFGLGDILSGLLKSAEHDLENGVEKGIGYFRQVEEILVWAVKQYQKPDFMQNEIFAVIQCGQVVEQWLTEAYGVTRTATSTLLPSVIAYFEAQVAGGGHSIDPFQKSRQMTEWLLDKWGIAAGVTKPVP